MKRIALAALLLGACGSSSGDVPSELLGTWAVATGTTGAAMAFDADGGYRQLTGSETVGGTLDGQLTTGTFAASGGSLSFVPQQSSCATAAPWSCTYRVSGGSLVLTDSGGTVAFARDTSTGTGVVTYGCFDTAGNFTPRPVSAL